MSDPAPELDPEPLLAALRAGGVDFVVIGGVATALWGSELPTFDVDVAYSRERENLERMAETLRSIDAKLRVARTEEELPFQLDARALSEGGNFTFRTPHGSLDILAFPAGAPAYAELRRRAEQFTIGETTFLAASIDDLIAMKETAGRVKDKRAALELRQISDLLRAPKEP